MHLEHLGGCGHFCFQCNTSVVADIADICLAHYLLVVDSAPDACSMSDCFSMATLLIEVDLGLLLDWSIDMEECWHHDWEAEY